MSGPLPLATSDLAAVSPWLEMGAYEALWAERGASFKTIADKFARSPGALPSDFIGRTTALEYASRADARIRKFSSLPYSVRVHGAGEYPRRVRAAKHPIEVLYYQGVWALSERPSLAIVGTRTPTEAGIAHAQGIVRALADCGYVAVAGLARGIDTAVHKTAIESGGHTIGVIGTPISMSYPSENASLQHAIALNHLLVSQVPVVEYLNMPLQKTRTFFPARNVTMSALTEGTVIVEASDRSGTLTQARAALDQGRKLFILESCLNRTDINWPRKFLEAGGIRVQRIEDILDHVSAPDKDR